ncbi:MAG: hypothetical protein H8E21_03815, partial [Gammaproteobacteria bacterium]|nr:hypothetical protein [Gammaproteobacteria bacterium]
MSQNPRSITILGATGSIGQSTLDVLARHPEHFHLYAVSANTQVEKMEKICRQYRPKVAVMSDRASATRLRQVLKDEKGNESLGGEERGHHNARGAGVAIEEGGGGRAGGGRAPPCAGRG